ncbi:MAG: hypothetical protein R2836_04085 [Chitinophagales bacterium]
MVTDLHLQVVAGNHQINNFGSVSEFSIAFWYKHNPANTGQKSLLSGSEMNPNVSDYVFSVELDNSGAGLVVYAYHSTYINTGSPIDIFLGNIVATQCNRCIKNIH